MSSKTCLFVTTLVLPGLLLGCVDPAVQGNTDTEDPTDTSSSGEPDTATGVTEPTTTNSVMTSDTLSTSTTDAPEGCADGEKNNEETDVDCGGGTCGPCDSDAACVDNSDCKSGNCDAGTCAPLLASCLALHEAKPDLPSGTYPLDPDGDGQAADFVCDMEPDSPGWTQVLADSRGTWDPVVEGECGEFGAMMGPFGTGDVLALAATAASVPHTELRVNAEAVIMDSWDAFTGEQLIIKLGDTEIFTQLCDAASSFSCNQESDVCGDGESPDGLLPVSTNAAAHDGDAIALSFTSNLDEPIEDESWGLRAVTVFVK
ncbi:fibrinogen-like YCDxxxxGGGW domain-containing protein [Nannocystis punicea]|uniref:Fibrinogen-like YCDxxxxGGGW domain-containing protein n=1 Tax=Nannocystis punicea TaxID=2995304 RepID=A0ABY7H4T7_9BACT|nr:fibrinogen-like YCDxxxxGGGW domain-containing protein [Nannocystis poenicansa]WAS94274.1 fibrinogen-like YCDxxxxGGGW domain-containing protein [Nannocystis poenicansa]